MRILMLSWEYPPRVIGGWPTRWLKFPPWPAKAMRLK